MTTTDEAPLYNIGIVARMTGVPVSTLRIWERRYQFPATARSAGRQRLYTEHEIARLRWVKAKTDEGMQVSQAVRALRHHEAKGGPSAPTYPPLAATGPVAPTAPGLAPGLDVVRARLYAALLNHDLAQADAVLGEAMTAYAPEQLIEGVIFAMLDEVGREWQAGRMNIATEHLMTNFVRHRMLQWLHQGPPVNPGARPVVLACAPGELHEGSLIMLGVLLRRRRWPVAYVGQDVPLRDLASLVREVRPAAVVLVAMTPGAAENVVRWPEHMPEAAAGKGPVVAFGGYVFSTQPEWRARMPGLWLGASVAEGVERLEAALAATEAGNPTAPPAQ